MLNALLLSSPLVSSSPALAEPSQVSVCKKGLTFSTDTVSPRDRRDWLEDMICQEYTRVSVKPPESGPMFNETTFYNLDKLRLSVIHSRGLTIEKFACEPNYQHQDNYLAVVLLAGRYALTQNNREVFLQPGDMTIYDATRPHRIHSSTGFSKLIMTIPRAMMRDRVAGIEHCTAMAVSGQMGIGAVATQFIQTAAAQMQSLQADDALVLSEQSLNLLTLSFSAIRPHNFQLSRGRSLSLRLVKNFVLQHLNYAELDAPFVAIGTRLSSRYINDLLSDDGTSLMRYVWSCRLEQCRKDMLACALVPVSTIAFKWGFNDMSHFSRAFKKRFGVSPTEFKKHASTFS